MKKPNKSELKALYPTEHQENLAFIAMCGAVKHKYPVLRELVHFPNEGRRGWTSQAVFRAIKTHLGEELDGKMVGQAGVHDWMLPVFRWMDMYDCNQRKLDPCTESIYAPDGCFYVSLFIEMKCQRGYYGTPRAIEKAYSAEQRDWARRMTDLGHKCVCCYGADEAFKAVMEYLGG